MNEKMRKGMRKDAMLRWLLTRGARVTRTRDMGGGVHRSSEFTHHQHHFPNWNRISNWSNGIIDLNNAHCINNSNACGKTQRKLEPKVCIYISCRRWEILYVKSSITSEDSKYQVSFRISIYSSRVTKKKFCKYSMLLRLQSVNRLFLWYSYLRYLSQLQMKGQNSQGPLTWPDRSPTYKLQINHICLTSHTVLYT